MRWGSVFSVGVLIFVSGAFAQFEPAAPAEKPSAVQAPPRPPELEAQPDPNESQDVRALLADLRNTSASINARQAAVDKLLANGDSDVQRVIDFTAKELKVRRKAYDAKLESSASPVLAARWKATGNIEREVESIRKPAVDVSRGPGLTKERIHSDVDPALKKLDALLSLDVATVLKEKPELVRMREELLFLADAWNAGVAKLSPEARKRDSAKGAQIPSRKDLEGMLSSEELQAISLASPMTPEDRKVLAANATLAPSLPSGEAEGVLILNRIRIRLGVGALVIDTHLCDAARGHSSDMKERNFFSHESPVAGKETPWKRAQLAGTSASAENIYTGSSKAADAIDGWWYSPGHHANMMGAHRRIGLGTKDGYWTMMLGD